MPDTPSEWKTALPVPSYIPPEASEPDSPDGPWCGLHQRICSEETCPVWDSDEYFTDAERDEHYITEDGMHGFCLCHDLPVCPDEAREQMTEQFEEYYMRRYAE
jgi:hypothetical protein